MDLKQQLHLWYFATAFFGLLLVQSWLPQASMTERIPYSTFLARPAAGEIASVTVLLDQIEGRCVDPIGGNTHFITRIVPTVLMERLERSDAELDRTVQNTFLSTSLSSLLPMLLIFALWSVFLRGTIRSGAWAG